MTRRSKPKLAVIRTDAEIVRDRLRHLGIVPMTPLTTPTGRLPEPAKQASKETALRIRAVQMAMAKPHSALD